jgi:hypothetical protein
VFATSRINSQIVTSLQTDRLDQRPQSNYAALPCGRIFYNRADHHHSRIILHPIKTGTSRFDMESLICGPHAYFGSHSWSWYVSISINAIHLPQSINLTALFSDLSRNILPKLLLSMHWDLLNLSLREICHPYGNFMMNTATMVSLVRNVTVA